MSSSKTSNMRVWHGEKEREVFELYSEDLDRLTINSKPVISNLTELADEYKRDFAPLIVRIIEDRVKRVPAEQKLSQLYLLDSIIKNHTDPYAVLFQQNLVSVFAGVFQACPNEKIRAQLFKLRSTWTPFFAYPKLNQLDRRVKEIDPAWPVQDSRKGQQAPPPAQQQPAAAAAPKIHVNPRMVNPDFIRQHKLPPQSVVAKATAAAAAAPPEDEISRMKQELERLKQEKIKMQIQKEIEAKKKEIEELKKVEEGKKKANLDTSTKQPSTSSSVKDSSKSSSSKDSSSSSSKTAGSSSPAKKRDPRIRAAAAAAAAAGDKADKSPESPASSSSSRAKSKTPERTRQPSSPDINKVSTKKDQSPSRKDKSPSRKDKSPSRKDKSPSRKDKSPSRKDKSPARPATSLQTVPTPAPAVKSPSRSPVEVTKEAETKAKSVTPPPPPSIREDYVKAKKDSAKEGGKGSSGRKRQRDEAEKTRDPSSSPSPPPVKTNRKESKKPFRVPKKKGGRMHDEDESAGFNFEGPAAEFENGSSLRPPKKGNKRQRGQQNNKADQSTDKKGRLTLDLFGDDGASSSSNPLPQPSPNSSKTWAKFKEQNPDEYRTPIPDNVSEASSDISTRNEEDFKGWTKRSGYPRRRQDSFRNMRSNRGRGHQGGFGPHPTPFTPEQIMTQDMNRLLANNPQLQALMSNPEARLVMVEQLTKQFEEMFRTRKINKPKYLDALRWAQQIREQAFVDKQRMQENMPRPGMPGPSPWAGGQGPMGQPGPMHGPQGPMQGPQGPVQGPQGPMRGPRVPMQGPQGPMQGHQGPQGPQGPSDGPQFDNSRANRDLPLANPQELDHIASDPIKRIEIDGQLRDIRFYGETAVIITGPEADDMKELMFKAEGTRRVIFDGNIFVEVEVGAKSYTEFQLSDGVTHTVKIGAPTRELWIDGQWHELYFDGKGVYRIGSTMHEVFLEGPPPIVDISETPRNDLCVGYVFMIIDGNPNSQVRLYLDSKPQVVQIAGKPHIFKFVKGLKILLINGHPFMTDFGGNAMTIYVNNVEHYVRLASLPHGVKAGDVRLWNMEGSELLPQQATTPSPPKKRAQRKKAVKKEPAEKKEESAAAEPASPAQDLGASPISSPERSMSPVHLQNENSQEPRAFDRLLSLIPNAEPDKKLADEGSEETHEGKEPTAAEAVNKDDSAASESHYSVKTPTGSRSMTKLGSKETPKTPETPKVDVHNLWSMLVSSGLVTSNETTSGIPGIDSNVATPVREKAEEKKEPEDKKPVEKEAQQPAAKPEAAKPEGEEPALEQSKPATEGTEVNAEAPLQQPPQDAAVNEEPVEIVLKSHHQTLKDRHESIINMLYDPTCKKCSNCGLRFPSTDMVAYSLHLDWHFRLKRRERDRAKMAQSRQWYLHTADWNKSDELEDSQMDDEDEVGAEGNALPTVPASDIPEENSCPICGEEFDRLFKQEEDFAKDHEGGLWILRNAIRPAEGETDAIPGRAYHPQCFGDRKNYLLDDSAHDVTADVTAPAADVTANGEVVENGQVEAEVKTEVAMDTTEGEKEPTPFEVKAEGDEDQTPAVKTEKTEETEVKADSESVEPVVKAEPEEAAAEESAPKEMDTSLDDSAGHLTDMKPPATAGPAAAEVGKLGGFVINLSSTKQPPLERRESTMSTASEDSAVAPPGVAVAAESVNGNDDKEVTKEPASEYDVDAIIQESDQDPDEVKPRFKRAKLTAYPPMQKDKELSSLCSIM